MDVTKKNNRQDVAIAKLEQAMDDFVERFNEFKQNDFHGLVVRVGKLDNRLWLLLVGIVLSILVPILLRYAV